MWGYLSIEVLSETMCLKRPKIKNSTLEVHIRYRILNG